MDRQLAKQQKRELKLQRKLKNLEKKYFIDLEIVFEKELYIRRDHYTLDSRYVAYQTWEIFEKTLDTIISFEDPMIDFAHIDKNVFIDMYKPLLLLLDGITMDKYLDFFYISSPYNIGQLVFRDNDSRLDFRDWAIELKILPSLEDVMFGK
jgi:hypothetical protein